MVFQAYSRLLTFCDSETFTSSGGRFQAKSRAVQAEAQLVRDVELIHLSDHCPRLEEQEKPLGLFWNVALMCAATASSLGITLSFL